MNVFKRWTSGIVSRVDAMVAKIENHEALINSAIAEFQKNVGRAQVALQSVRRDGDAMKARLEEEERARDDWKRRALDAGNDDEKAVECLRRSKRARENADALRHRLSAHIQTETALAADLTRLRDGLTELKEQRNLMRTRQSRARAMVAIQDGQGRMRGDIEEILERWEIHVAEHEIEGGCFADPSDPLKEAFEAEEERAALLAELDALRRQK